MKCQVTYTWGALVAREMFGLKVTMVPGYEVVQGPEEEPAPEEAEGEEAEGKRPAESKIGVFVLGLFQGTHREM